MVCFHIEDQGHFTWELHKGCFIFASLCYKEIAVSDTVVSANEWEICPHKYGGVFFIRQGNGREHGGGGGLSMGSGHRDGIGEVLDEVT